jgi:hypothetical protein
MWTKSVLKEQDFLRGMMVDSMKLLAFEFVVSSGWFVSRSIIVSYFLDPYRDKDNITRT